MELAARGDAGRAFGVGTRSAFAAHVGADSAGANAVDVFTSGTIQDSGIR